MTINEQALRDAILANTEIDIAEAAMVDREVAQTIDRLVERFCEHIKKGPCRSMRIEVWHGYVDSTHDHKVCRGIRGVLEDRCMQYESEYEGERRLLLVSEQTLRALATG